MKVLGWIFVLSCWITQKERSRSGRPLRCILSRMQDRRRTMLALYDCYSWPLSIVVGSILRPEGLSSAKTPCLASMACRLAISYVSCWFDLSKLKRFAGLPTLGQAVKVFLGVSRLVSYTDMTGLPSAQGRISTLCRNQRNREIRHTTPQVTRGSCSQATPP